MNYVHLCGILWSLLLAGNLPLQAQAEIRVFREAGGYLGVQIRDLTTEDVTRLGLSRELGVYVEEVEPGAPAAEAGIQREDVLVEYASIPLLGVRHLQRLVDETPPGRRVPVRLVRSGEEKSVEVRVGEASLRERPRFSARTPFFPDVEREFRFEFPGRSGGRYFFYSARPRLGIQAGTLTEQMGEFLGVPGKKGVLVLEVQPESPAAKAGLRAGDVITAVDGKPVSNPSELSEQLVSRHELEVIRNRTVQKLTVNVASQEATPGGVERL